MLDQKEHSFNPTAVVESRWNRTLMKSEGYVPEVMFYGANYIVGEIQKTREAAMLIAEAKTKELKDAMLSVGFKIMNPFPKAKA